MKIQLPPPPSRKPLNPHLGVHWVLYVTMLYLCRRGSGMGLECRALRGRSSGRTAWNHSPPTDTVCGPGTSPEIAPGMYYFILPLQRQNHMRVGRGRGRFNWKRVQPSGVKMGASIYFNPRYYRTDARVIKKETLYSLKIID